MANNWEKENSESGIMWNHRMKPGVKLAPSVARRSDQFRGVSMTTHYTTCVCVV